MASSIFCAEVALGVPVATRFSGVEDSLSLLPFVASGGYLATDESGAAGKNPLLKLDGNRPQVLLLLIVNQSKRLNLLARWGMTELSLSRVTSGMCWSIL